MVVKHIDIKHIESFESPTAFILGTFDGLHKGHQLLLSEAKKLHENIAILLIYTNKEITKEHQKSGVITTLDDRIRMFKGMGVNAVYLLNLGKDLLHLSAEEFIDKILFAFHPSSVVIGDDFRFGYKAKGTPADLVEIGKPMFHTKVVKPLFIDDQKISTSLIKEKLLSGDTKAAKEMLGYYYSLTGLVTKGFGLGNKLGFPTANIALDPNYFLPRHGVYFVGVTFENQDYFGMASLGYHPTVNEVNLPLLEVNIFDFDKDIYHKALNVRFIKFLRPEEKLPTLESLIAKIKEDRANCDRLIKEGDF